MIYHKTLAFQRGLQNFFDWQNRGWIGNNFPPCCGWCSSHASAWSLWHRPWQDSAIGLGIHNKCLLLLSGNIFRIEKQLVVKLSWGVVKTLDIGTCTCYQHSCTTHILSCGTPCHRAISIQNCQCSNQYFHSTMLMLRIWMFPECPKFPKSLDGSKSPKCRLHIPCGCLGCEARQCNSCAAKLRSVPQNIVSGGVPAPLFCANSPNILPDSPERIICRETTLGGFVSVKSHVVKMNQKRNKHATPYLGVQTI